MLQRTSQFQTAHCKTNRSFTKSEKEEMRQNVKPDSTDVNNFLNRILYDNRSMGKYKNG